jgi:hypothetical protein
MLSSSRKVSRKGCESAKKFDESFALQQPCFEYFTALRVELYQEE